MTFTMSQIEIAGTLSTGPVIHLDNIAKRICHDALEQTYDKLAPVEQELSLERFALTPGAFFQLQIWLSQRRGRDSSGQRQTGYGFMYLSHPLILMRK